MQTAVDSSRRESESEIVEQLDDRVRYTALPFVGRGIGLDDLMQEGRMALLRAARSWDPVHGVKLWTYARKFVLGAMIHYVSNEIDEPCRDVVDELRGGHRGGCDDETDGVSVLDRLASADASPEDLAELGEGLAILEQEIDSLNDDEKKVLWQLFGESLPHRDAAEVLGVGNGTIMRTKLNAMEKLRTRMEARA